MKRTDQGRFDFRWMRGKEKTDQVHFGSGGAPRGNGQPSCLAGHPGPHRSFGRAPPVTAMDYGVATAQAGSRDVRLEHSMGNDRLGLSARLQSAGPPSSAAAGQPGAHSFHAPRCGPARCHLRRGRTGKWSGRQPRIVDVLDRHGGRHQGQHDNQGHPVHPCVSAAASLRAQAHPAWRCSFRGYVHLRPGRCEGPRWATPLELRLDDRWSSRPSFPHPVSSVRPFRAISSVQRRVYVALLRPACTPAARG